MWKTFKWAIVAYSRQKRSWAAGEKIEWEFGKCLRRKTSIAKWISIELEHNLRLQQRIEGAKERIIKYEECYFSHFWRWA